LSASFGSGNTAATLFGALTLLNLTDLARTIESVRPPGRFYVIHVPQAAPALARPLVALILSGTCLIQTLSRAGLAATFGAAVVLLGAMLLARSRATAVSAPLIATVAIVVGLMVASLALNSGLLEQRMAVFGSDTVGRTQILAAHWAAVQAAPWSGYGLGTFDHVNTMIMSASTFHVLEPIGAAHNVYIQWLEEAGCLGAAAMFATVAIIATQLVLGVVRRRRMRSWLLAILAVLSLYAMHGATDYALQTPSMALFLSLLLGVGVGIAYQPGRRGARRLLA
jgi:O-antigen ligase